MLDQRSYFFFVCFVCVCVLTTIIKLIYLLQGSEIHLNDNAKPEACLNPETMLNKRLRVDKRNKLRINFQRFQETTR